MGWGAWAGLGQALQQVGSQQVPQYLERQRQDKLDAEAAQQRAVQNALLRDQLANDVERTNIARKEADDNAAARQRQADQIDEQHFYQIEAPQHYGQHIADAGTVYAEKANKFGLLPDANGIIQPTWEDQWKRRVSEGQLDVQRGQLGVARAQADSLKDYRNAVSAREKFEALSPMATPGLQSAYAAYDKALGDPLMKKGALGALQQEIDTQQERAWALQRLRIAQEHPEWLPAFDAYLAQAKGAGAAPAAKPQGSFADALVRAANGGK